MASKRGLEMQLDVLFSYRFPQQLAVLLYKNGELACCVLWWHARAPGLAHCKLR
jgi:hypothetical protein